MKLAAQKNHAANLSYVGINVSIVNLTNIPFKLCLSLLSAGGTAGITGHLNLAYDNTGAGDEFET